MQQPVSGEVESIDLDLGFLTDMDKANVAIG
jgi:hypothetical protein